MLKKKKEWGGQKQLSNIYNSNPLLIFLLTKVHVDISIRPCSKATVWSVFFLLPLTLELLRVPFRVALSISG